MEVTLVPATISDHDVLIEWMRTYYAFDDIPFELERASSSLKALLHDQDAGAVWMIEAGGSPAGYVVLTLGYSLEYDGRDAFIDELFIDEAYRGRGIGRRTLELVEDEARSRQVQAVHLEVERRNTAARGFYEKVGYADNDRLLLTKRLS